MTCMGCYYKGMVHEMVLGWWPMRTFDERLVRIDGCGVLDILKIK